MLHPGFHKTFKNTHPQWPHISVFTRVCHYGFITTLGVLSWRARKALRLLAENGRTITSGLKLLEVDPLQDQAFVFHLMLQQKLLQSVAQSLQIRQLLVKGFELLVALQVLLLELYEGLKHVGEDHFPEYAAVVFFDVAE